MYKKSKRVFVYLPLKTPTFLNPVKITNLQFIDILKDEYKISKLSALKDALTMADVQMS